MKKYKRVNEVGGKEIKKGGWERNGERGPRVVYLDKITNENRSSALQIKGVYRSKRSRFGQCKGENQGEYMDTTKLGFWGGGGWGCGKVKVRES